MSKGILQLALTGKVPLQLEYRQSSASLDNLELCSEPADSELLSDRVPGMNYSLQLRGELR